jgi:hypothetical protein
MHILRRTSKRGGLKTLRAHEEEIGMKKIYKEETVVVDQPGHL